MTLDDVFRHVIRSFFFGTSFVVAGTVFSVRLNVRIASAEPFQLRLYDPQAVLGRSLLLIGIGVVTSLVTPTPAMISAQVVVPWNFVGTILWSTLTATGYLCLAQIVTVPKPPGPLP